MPGLFDPFSLKNVTLRNRIIASPMCQVLGAGRRRPTNGAAPISPGLARGGAGLVVIEGDGRLAGRADDARLPGAGE